MHVFFSFLKRPHQDKLGLEFRIQNDFFYSHECPTGHGPPGVSVASAAGASGSPGVAPDDDVEAEPEAEAEVEAEEAEEEEDEEEEDEDDDFRLLGFLR